MATTRVSMTSPYGSRASVMTRSSPNCQNLSGYSCVPLSGMNGKIPLWPSRPPQPGHRGESNELDQRLVVRQGGDRGLDRLCGRDPLGAGHVVPRVGVDPLAGFEQEVDVGAPAIVARQRGGGRAGRGRVATAMWPRSARRDSRTVVRSAGWGRRTPRAGWRHSARRREDGQRPAAHHAVAWMESADIEADASRAASPMDRSMTRASSSSRSRRRHESVVSLVEGPAGRGLRAEAGGRQSEPVRPSIRGHDLALRMPTCQECADEVGHRRRRHPDPTGEVRRRVRTLVEQDAVDGVLIRSKVGIGHRIDDERAHPLLGREELEQEGQARSRWWHPGDTTSW